MAQHTVSAFHVRVAASSRHHGPFIRQATSRVALFSRLEQHKTVPLFPPRIVGCGTNTRSKYFIVVIWQSVTFDTLRIHTGYKQVLPSRNMSTYVLTGANRGLGLEFVRQLSADSSNTVIGAVRSMSNDLTDLKGLNKNNNIHVLECDTGNASSIKSFVESCGKTLNGKKIDYLLNNSGINSVPEQGSLTMREDDLAEQMRINVLGPQRTTEGLYTADLLSSDVRILNMTSGLGSMQVSKSIKPRKCCTYSISKAALNMLTIHQGEDLREKLPGAVVICMDPGWVKTRMGGEGAEIEAHVSISGMLKVLHGLKKDDTATYWTYNGTQVEW